MSEAANHLVARRLIAALAAVACFASSVLLGLSGVRPRVAERPVAVLRPVARPVPQPPIVRGARVSLVGGDGKELSVALSADEVRAVVDSVTAAYLASGTTIVSSAALIEWSRWSSNR